VTKKGIPVTKKFPQGAISGSRGGEARFAFSLLSVLVIFPSPFWQFKDKFEFIIAENRFTWYIHRKNPTQKVGRLRRRAAVFLWKSFGEF